MTRPRFLICLPRDRFAAPVGRLAEIASRLASCGILHITNIDDLFVACDVPPTLLSIGRGWLIGRLFGNQKAAPFPDRLAHVDTESAARTILESNWGHYVAVLKGADGEIAVVRDPSGQLPCYYSVENDVVILVSDLDLLNLAGFSRPAVKWDKVAGFLQLPQFRSRTTALSNITELGRGECLTIANRQPRSSVLWTPLSFAAPSQQYAHRDAALRHVRHAVLSAIKGETADYDHVLLGLSGGLDSSIVAAGLRQAQVRFTCLTLSTKEAGGDERVWAQQVADHLEAPLLTVQLDDRCVDVTRSAAAHLPWPSSRFLRKEVDRQSAIAAGAHGIDAHFGGSGGDSVFCYLASASPVTDRWLTEGSSNVWRSIVDIAELTGASLATVTRMAAVRLLPWRRSYQWRPRREFLSSSLRNAPIVVEHPWLEASPRLLPGKAAHVAMLMQHEHELECLGGSSLIPHHAPLMNQHVQQACLRVPTWMWSQGGINRSVAREAFADLLPASIIARRLKGAPQSFSARVFERNRTVLRSFICDGVLAAHELLDVDALRDYIRAPGPVRDEGYLRILALANVEAWVRARE